MNNLKKMYPDDEPAYLRVLDKLAAELKAYEERIAGMYAAGSLEELRVLCHNLRNIGGLLGQTKLKITAAYWEGLCITKSAGNIQELSQSIRDTLQTISDGNL